MRLEDFAEWFCNYRYLNKNTDQYWFISLLKVPRLFRKKDNKQHFGAI